jgi:succinate dehydrogenase/fumarate reductase cytochrome b subunit
MADFTVLAHSLAGFALLFYIFHVNSVHSAMFRLLFYGCRSAAPWNSVGGLSDPWSLRFFWVWKSRIVVGECRFLGSL